MIQRETINDNMAIKVNGNLMCISVPAEQKLREESNSCKTNFAVICSEISL